MKPKIAAVGLAHPFEVGYDEAPALLDATAESLRRCGADCLNTGVVMHDLETVRRAAETLRTLECDVLLICIATWSEDHHLLDLMSYVEKPVLLRAYPAVDTGSLCCAHQIGAVFYDVGKTFDFVYGEAEDEDCARKTVALAMPYALAAHMSHVKMGTIGGRVKGMTEIAYDEFAIKEKLGARIVNIDEKEMTSKVAAMSDDEAERLLEEKKALLPPCRITSTHEGMLESIKYYAAL